MSSPHPTAQEPSNSFVKRPPNVQFPANHYEKPDPTPGPSSHPQNFPSKVIGGNEATPTDTFHPSPRHSGTLTTLQLIVCGLILHKNLSFYYHLIFNAFGLLNLSRNRSWSRI